MATLETTSLLGNGAAGGLVSSSVSAESCIPASCSRTTNCAGKITAVFDDITISSNFDSGNLARAEECRVHDGPDTREFDLWTAHDCAETEFENGNKTWFYFSVTTPQNFSKILRFNIRNLNRQSRLYQQGLTPITKTVPGRSGWERLKSRVDYENTEEGMRITFQMTIADSRKLVTYFAFCYPYSYSECQRRLSKLDGHYKISALLFESDPESRNKIYYYRELLCHSLEGRRIDLITITSLEGVTTEREARLLHLFPDQMAERCHVFKNKRVVFVSSRVHPGETPSSHVFNGLLNFLLRPDDARAIAVRKKFVFKLVPMLNPDGVFRGHYRTDTRGANLNRYYLDPDPALHPSIYAVKSLILHYNNHSQGHLNGVYANGNLRRAMPLVSKSCTFPAKSATIADRPAMLLHCRDGEHNPFSTASTNSDHQAPSLSIATTLSKSMSPRLTLDALQDGMIKSALISHSLKSMRECEEDPRGSVKSGRQSGVELYVDLHAHATKRGVFMYGNYFSDVTMAAENMLFPKLLSLNSPHLDFEHCVFSEKNMYTTDRRDGMSKEGSGRVAVHKATGIISCYTLECNYNSGQQCNALQAATLDDGRASPAFAFSPISRRFSIADFEQVGRALAYSLLDLHQLNPWTRLPNTSFGSVSGVRQNLLHRVTAARSKKMSGSNPVTNPGIPIEDRPVAGELNGDVASTVMPQSITASLTRKKQFLAISKFGSGMMLPTEGTQQRSAMVRGTTCLQGIAVPSYSKASMKRTNPSRKTSPYTAQAMKPSPTNVVFPSATREDRNSLNVGSSTLTSKQETAVNSHLPVPRKPLLSGKRVTPLNRGSTHKVANFQAANLAGRGVKGSILVASSHHHHHHQRNYVPPLEYYAKGSLLKVPDHIMKSKNSPGNKTLTTKKLSPIDPVMSPAPDQVVSTSASH